MPCCLCFSDAPLHVDELKGQRAVAIGRYVANVNTFHTRLVDAPCTCATLPCCLISAWPYLSPCVQVHMRHRVLNHVSPGSGWKHYQCCQGYCPVCCFKPSDTEFAFPCACMYLEACCCPGLAASANRFVIMDKYGLMPDPCDNQIIRMNNCLLMARCVCDIAAIFMKELRHAAQLLDCFAEVLFWSTLGCMTAQTYAEVQFRESAAEAVVYQPMPAGGDYGSYEAPKPSAPPAAE
jgi:hypothetical protein